MIGFLRADAHTHTHTQKGERKKPEKEEGGARGKQVEPF